MTKAEAGFYASNSKLLAFKKLLQRSWLPSFALFLRSMPGPESEGVGGLRRRFHCQWYVKSWPNFKSFAWRIVDLFNLRIFQSLPDSQQQQRPELDPGLTAQANACLLNIWRFKRHWNRSETQSGLVARFCLSLSEMFDTATTSEWDRISSILELCY